MTAAKPGIPVSEEEGPDRYDDGDLIIDEEEDPEEETDHDGNNEIDCPAPRT